jgi:chloride channel protein, CIC family
VPNTETLHRERPETPTNSPQPNILAAAPDAALMTAKMWTMVLLTGVGAGLTSGFLMRLLRLVQHLSFSYSTGDFLTGVRNTSWEHRIIVVTLGGIIAGLSLYCLRRITGSSGAEVTGAIWHKQGRFEAAPTIAKSLISIVIVGMGAAIGREAALKDTGGTVGGKISDWTSLSPEQRHLLVSCGAGAGMAAAYNVPLGGALFVIEVLLGTMSLTNVLAAVITSFVAVAVSWLLLPNIPTFNVAQLAITPSLLLWAAVAGPILGAASAVYVRFIGWSETGSLGCPPLI